MIFVESGFTGLFLPLSWALCGSGIMWDKSVHKNVQNLALAAWSTLWRAGLATGVFLLLELYCGQGAR